MYWQDECMISPEENVEGSVTSCGGSSLDWDTALENSMKNILL